MKPMTFDARMNLEALRSTQRETLRGSIGKWTLIVDAVKHNRPFVEAGPADCPCCKSFRGKRNSRRCESCPISLHTGENLCNGSPYEEWEAGDDGGVNYSPFDYRGGKYPKRLLSIAEKELEFLIKLGREYGPAQTWTI